MNKYEILNQLNDKYNLYRFEITCYDEAKEFYHIMAKVYNLDIPAVEISDSDMKLAQKIINNWGNRLN